jgi:hypothetical protein
MVRICSTASFVSEVSFRERLLWYDTRYSPPLLNRLFCRSRHCGTLDYHHDVYRVGRLCVRPASPSEFPRLTPASASEPSTNAWRTTSFPPSAVSSSVSSSSGCSGSSAPRSRLCVSSPLSLFLLLTVPQSQWGSLGFCQEFEACRVLSAIVAFSWLSWVMVSFNFGVSLTFILANGALLEPLHGQWVPTPPDHESQYTERTPRSRPVSAA